MLDISAAGRRALADHGVLVQDSWTPAALQATGQEEFGSGISVPPLEVGDEATVFFQIDASRSRAGTPTVEFVLLDGDAPAGRVGSSRRGLSVVPVTDAHELPPARSRRDARSDVVRSRTESQAPTPVGPFAQIVPEVASESAPRTDIPAPETERTQQAAETAD